MEFLYQAFGFLFKFFLDIVNNYGVALLLFTLFFRLILLPSTIKQQKSSAKTMRLQPKLKRIREKYQDYNPQERQQKIQQETSALYQREGTSPMGGGCLPLLIQLPVIYGLLGVIRNPLTYILQIPAEVVEALKGVVTQVVEVSERQQYYVETIILSNIEKIMASGNEALAGIDMAAVEKIRNFDFTIFGIDLGSIPSEVFEANKFALATLPIIAVPVLSGISSLLTSVISQIRQKKNNPAMENQQMMGCMMLTMPLLSIGIAWSLPVGIGMYWTLSGFIAFIQTLVLGHIYAPRKTIARLMVDETIYRRSYENTKKIATEKTAETEE